MTEPTLRESLAALARECQGLVSKYTRAVGENGDRVADLLIGDTYRIGTEMLALLAAHPEDDPAPSEPVTDTSDAGPVLTEDEAEQVRRMAYAGSYSREKADRYVRTVKSILAARLAKVEATDQETIRLLGVSDGRKGIEGWLRARAADLRDGGDRG